jgi:hypothetical protein
MRAKILVLFFMLALSFMVKAQEDKTYLRDRSTCDFGGKKFELEIRSNQLYAESTEMEYGEVIVLNKKVIEMNDQGIGRYRMITLMNEHCSKSLAMPIKKDHIAFFFLKDNRPFTDQLTVFYYNLKTHATQVLSTQLTVRSAVKKAKHVYFRLARDSVEPKFETILIENQKFNTTEKPFETWVAFDGVKFKTDLGMSYDYFEFKDLLPRITFETTKDLGTATYKVATRGKQKCLSFKDSAWVCKTINHGLLKFEYREP